MCNIFERSYGFFQVAFAFMMPPETLNFGALGEDPRKPEDIPMLDTIRKDPGILDREWA